MALLELEQLRVGFQSSLLHISGIYRLPPVRTPVRPLLCRSPVQCLASLASFQDAELALKQALNLDSLTESPYLDLNIIYSKRNEPDKQIAFLTRYLSHLPPDSRNATLVRKRLRELKGGSIEGPVVR